ncbi:MAG: hypothetical protein AABW58_01770 [Nanoarchaeota archaeon]
MIQDKDLILLREDLIKLSRRIGRGISEDVFGRLSIIERKKQVFNQRTEGNTSKLDAIADTIIVYEAQKIARKHGIPISILSGGDKIKEEVNVSVSGSLQDRVVFSCDGVDGTTNAMTDGMPWASALFGYTDPTSKPLEGLKFGDFVTGAVYVVSGTSFGTVKTGNLFFAYDGCDSAILNDVNGGLYPLLTTEETQAKNWTFGIDTMAARATYLPGPERDTKGSARRQKFWQALTGLIGTAVNDEVRLFGAGLEQMAILSPATDKIDTTLSFYSGNPRLAGCLAAYQFKDNIIGPKTILKKAGAKVVVFAGPQKGMDIDEVPLQPHTHYLAAGNDEVKNFVLDALKDYNPD